MSGRLFQWIFLHPAWSKMAILCTWARRLTESLQSELQATRCPKSGESSALVRVPKGAPC